jgi:hypothetical protein
LVRTAAGGSPARRHVTRRVMRLDRRGLTPGTSQWQRYRDQRTRGKRARPPATGRCGAGSFGKPEK